MRRHLLVDNVANNGVLGLTKNKKFVVGLLVGQITEERDYVIHYIPTPSNEPEVAEEGEKNDNLDNLDEAWIVQHAKQVTRLLPGGLDIIGLFLIAPSPKFETKLRQVLYACYKALGKYENVYGQMESSARVTVEICNVTKKINCRTYNVYDDKSGSNPSEWKVVTDRSQVSWVKLESKLTLDMKLAISKSKAAGSMLKQINGSLASYFAQIRNAVVLIDNKSTEKSQLLFDKRHNTKYPKQLSADLLFQMDNSLESSEIEGEAVLTLKGTVHIRAFVQNKATVGLAHKAVKTDAIRSLMSRAEIHCEDCLVTDQEQSDMQGVHELPRRLFAPINGTDVSLSDYVLMGEKPIDSLDVFSDIMGLMPLEEDIEDDCEISPEAVDGSLSGCSSEEDLANEETVEQLQGNFLVPIISGGLAAVFAAGVAYLYNQ